MSRDGRFRSRDRTITYEARCYCPGPSQGKVHTRTAHYAGREYAVSPNGLVFVSYRGKALTFKVAELVTELFGGTA